MKKRNLLFIGFTTAYLLTGCQTNTNDTEKEALKEQITQLEQQVTTLEQQISTPADTDNITADRSPEENGNPSDGESAETTQTIEELTALVEDYEEKVKAAVPTGSTADDMEQFFTLKQEEDQIDDALDLHEDELEFLYRSGSLTRDEYKSLENELDLLEDRLDDAEDWLEITFGIDD